ncbi:MAG: hypothetical protein NTW11_03875 [Candidatus Staskawiczbacteria bacterium]|nr:hypothetical protein [Candidatus Staskawiczbacteria bacterium]
MQEQNTNYTPPVYPADKPATIKPKKAIPTFVGIAIIVLVALVLFGGVFAWQYFLISQKDNQSQNPVACTEEAKICPDGSAVGRTGPNCEFAQCPDLTAGWQTYINGQYGFLFQYPTTSGSLFELQNGIIIVGEKGVEGPATRPEGILVHIPSYFDGGKTNQSANPIESINNYYGNGYTKTYVAVGGVESIMISSLQIGDWIFVPLPNNQVIKIEGNYGSTTFQKILSTFKFTTSADQALDKEKACLADYGVVTTQTCYCSGIQDFYNSCAIGGCTCTPDPKYKRTIKVCNCGMDRCWNGKECISTMPLPDSTY